MSPKLLPFLLSVLMMDGDILVGRFGAGMLALLGLLCFAFKFTYKGLCSQECSPVFSWFLGTIPRHTETVSFFTNLFRVQSLESRVLVTFVSMPYAFSFTFLPLSHYELQVLPS